MAWCLKTPSHYLNQCWLITKPFWGIHLKTISQKMFMHLIHNWRYISIITTTSPKGQWVYLANVRKPWHTWTQDPPKPSIQHTDDLTQVCSISILNVQEIPQTCTKLPLKWKLWESHLNPLHAKFFRGNINIYLHFVSFIHIDMTQVLTILPQVREGPTYSI